MSGRENPTIFHVTQWKAGSQWIGRILKECVPDRIVPPELEEAQFLARPIQEGKIYPTLYITRQQWESVRLPARWRRFVVVRDLRDTLVSAYFSIRTSHVILSADLARWRTALQGMTVEHGLLYLIDEWLPLCAPINESWLESGEPVIRYEDLLEHDLEVLERILLDECELPVDRHLFRDVVLANRFESVTGGRHRGQEDQAAHERKGVAGDWRHHFTDGVKTAFKARYGELLVAGGYERNQDW